jgi:hypothetical protein
MGKIIVYYLFVLLFIIAPCVSADWILNSSDIASLSMDVILKSDDLFLNHSDKITNVEAGKTNEGNWIYLETNNLSGFTGNYMHFHIYNSSSLAKFPDTLSKVIFASDLLAYAFSFEIAPILLFLDGAIILAETGAKNNDGSYDFYILKEDFGYNYYFYGFMSKDKKYPIGIFPLINQIPPRKSLENAMMTQLIISCLENDEEAILKSIPSSEIKDTNPPYRPLTSAGYKKINTQFVGSLIDISCYLYRHNLTYLL